MYPFRIREHLDVYYHSTMISRDEFEQVFRPTNEKVTFTFAGWDGKSYDGETRTARVLRTGIFGYETVRFIKVGKALHYIEEDREEVELATGIPHKVASWLVDVDRRPR